MCPDRRPQDVLVAGSELWCVHQSRYPQPSFNPTIERDGRGARFGPTKADPFATLHAGASIEVAFAETLVRQARRKLLSPTHLRGMSLTSLVVQRNLTLVDLRSGGTLGIWGADPWLVHCEKPDYRYTRQWPRWLRTCAPAAHGLMWMSKRYLAEEAYVFFADRLHPRTRPFVPGPPIALDEPVGRAFAIDMLRDVFDIELGSLRAR